MHHSGLFLHRFIILLIFAKHKPEIACFLPTFAHKYKIQTTNPAMLPFRSCSPNFTPKIANPQIENSK